MEVLILIIVVAFIGAIIWALVERSQIKDQNKSVIELMSKEYPNSIGEMTHVLMYNIDKRNVYVTKLSASGKEYANIFHDIYVSKAVLCDLNIYIDNKCLLAAIKNKKSTAFIVDEPNENVCFLEFKEKECTINKISFKDIISVTIEQDGQTIFSKSTMRTIGGAVGGSLLMGEAGAVVGGLSGNSKQATKVKRISIKILIRDIANSTFELVIFEGDEIKSTDEGYKNLMRYAGAIKDCISVIIDKMDKESSTNSVQEETNEKVDRSLSIADELSKLAKLKEQGILSDDEFISQKEKLLNK